MSAPQPPPDTSWLSYECGNCGRDVNDPRAHWHDLCYPWAAKITLAGFVLVEVLLLVMLVRTLL